MMSGFEASMVGCALFGSLFGMQAVCAFANVDLGQVLFVFLILVPALQGLQGKRQSWGVMLLIFARTPVIIAIMVGIAANFSGIYVWMSTWSLTAALMDTSQMVASMPTPLVAMVLGYALNLSTRQLRRPFCLIAILMGIWVTLGILIATVLVAGLLRLERIFQTAVVLIFILPPPIVVSLFTQGADAQERESMVATLSLATLVTLTASVILRAIY